MRQKAGVSKLGQSFSFSLGIIPWTFLFCIAQSKHLDKESGGNILYTYCGLSEERNSIAKVVLKRLHAVLKNGVTVKDLSIFTVLSPPLKVILFRLLVCVVL